ncbi:MAG TPA: hypothetical protein VE032_01720 [Actinomycetota bacterium]|nr:hypothetical protein [Actinomycetota bacterium]
MRERGSVTVAIMAAALILLFAGSLYVVAAAPRPERPRPSREAKPTLAVRTPAEMDAAAQTSARSATAAAVTVYGDLGSFDDVTPALLGMIEPSLSYTTGESGGEAEASVVGHRNTFAVAVRSASGTCWWLRMDGRDGAVSHGSGQSCSAADALAADASAW